MCFEMVQWFAHYDDYLQRRLFTLAINNPDIQRDKCSCARQTAACSRSIYTSLLGHSAAINRQSAFPSVSSALVLFLGDAAFHLDNFGPPFIFVCVLIVLYVLLGYNNSTQLKKTKPPLWTASPAQHTVASLFQ